jgi:hypothetical protein
VFENRVLKRIIGPKGDEATGRWRKLYTEEGRNLWRTLVNMVMDVRVS